VFCGTLSRGRVIESPGRLSDGRIFPISDFNTGENGGRKRLPKSELFCLSKRCKRLWIFLSICPVSLACHRRAASSLKLLTAIFPSITIRFYFKTSKDLPPSIFFLPAHRFQSLFSIKKSCNLSLGAEIALFTSCKAGENLVFSPLIQPPDEKGRGSYKRQQEACIPQKTKKSYNLS
jgi:hypothetical protein